MIVAIAGGWGDPDGDRGERHFLKLAPTPTSHEPMWITLFNAPKRVKGARVRSITTHQRGPRVTPQARAQLFGMNQDISGLFTTDDNPAR